MLDFIRAFALLLILEGILPFLSPIKWRETIQVLSQFEDKKVRLVGLIIMLIGVLTLISVHFWFD